MNKSTSSYPSLRSGESDLGDFMREIWAARGFVFAGLTLGAVCALAFCILAVPYYRAEMIVAPASPMESAVRPSAQASYTGQVSGETLQRTAENFERFQAVAKGAALSSLLLRSEALMRGLEQDRAFSFLSPQSQAWTPERLAEYIDQRVQFAPVGETALRAMRYEHPDPVFAVEFLKRIAALSDGLIRHTVRNDVNERIDYLQMEFAKNLNPDHRRALTDLLMEQERLRMMVSIDQPYAAAIVESAYASSAPRWPDAMLVFPAFMAVGALVGFILFSALYRQESSEENIEQDEFAYENPDVQRAKDRLRSMRKWHAPAGENSNERPLTGGRKKPFSSSDAAE